MKLHRFKALCVCVLAAFPTMAPAADLSVELVIPAMDIAEYHRPYVAVWVEDSRRKQVGQIALWLEQEKWHRDVRSWWRRGGNRMELPVDGVSGATRKPGRYRIHKNVKLEPGRYTLNVEAVREVGGREHLRILFDWTGATLSLSASGKTELGLIKFVLNEEKIR